MSLSKTTAPFSQNTLVGLGLLVLLAIFNLWVLFAVQLPGDTAFWHSLHDAGHGLIFLVLGLVLSLVFHHFIFSSRARIILATLVFSLAFGGAVELVQARVGRSASWSDFGLDILGTVAGLALYASWQRIPPGRIFYIVISIVLLLLNLATPLKYKLAENYRQQLFPLIADFESRWLNFYVQRGSTARLSYVSPPDGWPVNNGEVLRVEQSPGHWPGVYITEVFPDWRNYTSLVFSVLNPGKAPTKIVVRVHDSWHNQKYGDRYNKTFQLQPGYQEVNIPLQKISKGPKQRELDMSRIEGIIIYSYKLEQYQELFIDNVRLE